MSLKLSVDLPKTILLVEHDEPLRKFLTEMLRGVGHTVLEADSAHAALDLASDNHLKVDLVLSDLALPGISGVQLFELLKASLPDLKAVLMSGYPLELISLTVPLPRSVAFIEKPFTRDCLLSALYKTLH